MEFGRKQLLQGIAIFVYLSVQYILKIKNNSTISIIQIYYIFKTIFQRTHNNKKITQQIPYPLMQVPHKPTSPLSRLNQINVKQLSQTHSTTQFHQLLQHTSLLTDCPSCQNKTTKVCYYSCCLLPSCDGCYNGFHYLECEKKNRMAVIDVGNKQQINRQNNNAVQMCERCQNMINDYIYSCQQCRISAYCSTCFDKIHKSTKFQTHRYKKQHKNLKLFNNKNILTCTLHNKYRTILTQSSQLICTDCCTLSKNKKYRNIDLQSNSYFQIVKQNIGLLGFDIQMKDQNHKARWLAIKNQLLGQYNKMTAMLAERYEQNTQILQQMQQYDMKIINKAKQIKYKIQKQTKIKDKSNTNTSNTHNNNNNNKNNNNNNNNTSNTKTAINPILTARLTILQQQITKLKNNIQANQLFVYKIGNLDMQKFDTVIKTFNVNKFKLRQTQDKQKDKQNNLSIKKMHNNSLQKPHAANLSLSRRSLSKSISKIENNKSTLKQSIYSVNRSQNLSQHVSTQPIRNSTPPHTTQPTNSSDKKSTLLRQSSIMTAKLQDITPVILNFDLKQSNGSRINFLSNKIQKTQQQNCLTQINPNNCSQSSQSRISKRKSDYFQLRERMRKPSNVVNNRFSMKR